MRSMKYVDWFDEWIYDYKINEKNIMDITHNEIGKVFIKVLELQECTNVRQRKKVPATFPERNIII